MKPLQHAKISAKKHGGKWEDYIDIHNFFDQTKAHIPDMRHRAILHNAFGIFLCAQQFGEVRTNSAGREYSVRDIGEDHVLEDLGTIPTLHEVISCISTDHLQWLGGLPKNKKTLVARIPKAKKAFAVPQVKLVDPKDANAFKMEVTSKKDVANLPSYHINEKGTWTCNECGNEGSDVLFLSHLSGCSVLEAAKLTPEQMDKVMKAVEGTISNQTALRNFQPSSDQVVDGGAARYHAMRKRGFRGSTID